MAPFPVGDLNRSPTVGDIIRDWFFFFYTTKMNSVTIRLMKNTDLTIIPLHYNFSYTFFNLSTQEKNTLSFSTLFRRRQLHPTLRHFLPPLPQSDRGMSPVRTKEFVDECDQCPSGSGYSSKSSPWWRRTPSSRPNLIFAIIIILC
jgi:hypothetical protein